MSREGTSMNWVIAALVLIAILISAGTLYYVSGVLTAMSDATTAVSDLQTVISDLTTIVGDLATVVNASTEDLLALEDRLKGVEDALTKPEKIVFTVHGWFKPPPAGHYNAFAGWPGVVISGFAYERLAYWVKATGVPGEFTPELATSWEIAELSLTAYIREGVVWHDGEPFTSKDVWTTFMVGRCFDWAVWQYIDEIETPDDFTVIFKLKKTYIMTPISILNQLIYGPYHIYGSFADRVAAGEDLAAIRDDVNEFRPDGLVGTGPFKLKTITESESVLEKNPDHFAAANIGIDEVSLPVILSNELGWAYYLGDSIDTDWFFMPESVENEVAAKPYGNVMRVSDLAGGALAFNHEHQWLSDVRVRKAIAYAIDPALAAPRPWAPITPPTGILTGFVDDWLTSEELAALESYDLDLSTAAQLLEDAGFTKPADRWLDPEGNPFTLSAYAPGGWTDVVVQMESIAAQLNEFGIDVTLYTPESTTYWGKTFPDSEFDLAWAWWGAWNPHPYGSFSWFLWTYNGRPYSGIQFPEVVGTVNVTEALIELGETLDVEEQKALVWDLVEILNEELPIYPYAEKQMHIFYSTTRFLWPSQTDPLWASYPGDAYAAIAALIKTGKIVPRA